MCSGTVSWGSTKCQKLPAQLQGIPLAHPGICTAQARAGAERVLLWAWKHRKSMAAKRILSLMRGEWHIPQLRKIAQLHQRATVLNCTGSTSPVNARSEVLVSQTILLRPAWQLLADPLHTSPHQISWQGSKSTSCTPLADDIRLPSMAAAQDLSEETDDRASSGQSPIYEPNDHHWPLFDRGNLNCVRTYYGVGSCGGPNGAALWTKSVGRRFHSQSWWRQKWSATKRQAAGLSPLKQEEEDGIRVSPQSFWEKGEEWLSLKS